MPTNGLVATTAIRENEDQKNITGTTVVVGPDTKRGLDVNIIGGEVTIDAVVDVDVAQYTESDTDASITGIAAMMEGAANTLLPIQGTVADGLLVNLGSNNDVVISDGGNTITVDDGGTSLTVDGTVELGATSLAALENISVTVTSIGEVEVTNDAGNPIPVSATNLDIRDLTFAADKVDASGSTLGANSGTDIGDVTINNGSGGSAVNIQDGGNSITVDGTVAATQSGTWTVTGAGGTFPVTDSGGSLTVDNNGTFAVQADTELTTADLDTGAGTDTRAVVGMVLAASGGGVLVGTANPMPISDNSGSITVDNGGTFAVQAAQSGTWTVQPGNTANTTAWLVKEIRTSTATHSNVNDTASSTTLLASNANRIGASIYNDSTVILYLKLGATASTTSFTTKLRPEDYYEVPFGYTGIIDGIWASDASGAARIVEYT